METIGAILDGFSVALTPLGLMWAFIGVTLGTVVGVLPGIGPALTVALLLPVTFQLDPTYAFIMFAGIYYGGMYGGSTTAILLNTPGESSSIITAVEGNLMARRGRGASALATAAIGSFVASTLATLALSFLAPFIVDLALRFGPAEYFALMVLAFTTVSAVLGRLDRARNWPAFSWAWRWDWSASTCRRGRRVSRSGCPSSSTASMWWWSRSASLPSAKPSTWPRARVWAATR